MISLSICCSSMQLFSQLSNTSKLQLRAFPLRTIWPASDSALGLNRTRV